MPTPKERKLWSAKIDGDLFYMIRSYCVRNKTNNAAIIEKLLRKFLIEMEEEEDLKRIEGGN